MRTSRLSQIVARHVVEPLEPVTGRTRCTLIDYLCVASLPTVVLGYTERLDPSRLRDALARVLGDFGSFAGRLSRSRGELYIEYGAGALFEVAESAHGCDVFAAALRTKHSELACPRLSLLRTVRGKSPLFAVRVTQTPDGSVLGVTWNHALGDYRSAMLLLRAWTLAYRGRPYSKPIEVADRAAYLDERVPKQSRRGRPWRLLSWLEFLRNFSYQLRTMRASRRVAFEFSWQTISTIHASASPESLLTPFDLLCAHIFWTLRELEPEVCPHFALSLDFRKRFGLPANLLGNASDVVITTLRPEADANELACALRASIEAFGPSELTERGLATFRATHPGVLRLVRCWKSGEPRHINLFLTNLARAGHDQLVFAASRPMFVHARPSDARIVGLGTIFPSARAAGLTLEIVLPSRLIERVVRERGWRLQAPPLLQAPPVYEAAPRSAKNRIHSSSERMEGPRG